jgi:signal transduction histidine kinase
MRARWYRDTLAKRLFFLMWAALVVSHVVAHQVVMGFIVPNTPTLAGFEDWRIPSLPPTPGLDPELKGMPPDQPGEPPGMPSRGPSPGGPDQGMEPENHEFHAGGPPHHGPGAGTLPLSSRALLADYLIRMTVIAIFSVLGARWLSVPVRRLIAGARALPLSLSEGKGTEIDERQGTVEIREASGVFNKLTRQLAAQFRSRELLLAALSHDLRTPLTRIRLRLESFPDTPEKLKSVLDIRSMNALIDESLEVFRNISSIEPLRKTDIHALCQSIVDDAVEQRQDAVLRGDATIAMARPQALQRVITNLVVNAMRYAGNAIVTVTSQKDSVHVTVEDDGPGIPEDKLEAVLQPFVRVDSSRSRETGGSGLGLFIASDLMEKQGGELKISNRPSGGLCVRISLPIRALTTARA